MNNDRQIACGSCGRTFNYGTQPEQCSCGAYFSEYKYTLPGCIRNKKPGCVDRAVIANTTVETVSQMKGMCDAFVHVTENNTTYYLDSSGYPMITWAGPLDMVRYDIDNNPNKLKRQLLHTVRTTTNPVTGEDEDDDVVVYYDSRGDAHVLMTEDDITRMFEYIQNEEAQIWAAIDTKQDTLTAGSNIIIDKDPNTGVVTISATGSGAAYTAGANIQISPYNVISATDTKYTAGQNITINDQNIISAIVDLTNYYNKAEVNQLISDLDSISMRVVATLPTTGVSNIIYLVQRQGENVYDQWVYSDNQWFNIGDTEIDLSAYYTKAQADVKFQELLSEGNNIDPVTDSTELSSVDLSNKVVDKVAVSDLWDYMWKKIYPVGSIYTTVTNDDPSTLFGGTWERINGRFLVGAGSNGASGNEALNLTAGTTGGVYRHQHSYGIKYGSYWGQPTTDSDSTAIQLKSWNSSNTQSWTTGTQNGNVQGRYTSYSGSGSLSSLEHSANTNLVNNLPPYLTVYIWKRTA